MTSPAPKPKAKTPAIVKALKMERGRVALLERQAQRAIEALHAAKNPQD